MRAFSGASTAAGIVATPCGRFVYVSNRGHDGVAAFAVEQASHTLRPLGWSASQTSDSIAAFTVATDGKPQPAGTAGSPVCILFALEEPQT